MSKKIKPLTIQMVNELQIVLGAMELGDYESSLRAIVRTTFISEQLRAEIVGLIAQRQREELEVIKRSEALKKLKGTLETRKT